MKKREGEGSGGERDRERERSRERERGRNGFFRRARGHSDRGFGRMNSESGFLEGFRGLCVEREFRELSGQGAVLLGNRGEFSPAAARYRDERRRISGGGSGYGSAPGRKNREASGVERSHPGHEDSLNAMRRCVEQRARLCVKCGPWTS